MSAAEIIEKIKRLPPEEQQQVREYVNENPLPNNGNYASDADFKKAADEVFTKYDNLLRKLAK